MVADLINECVLNKDNVWRFKSHTLRPVFMSNETPPSMQIDPNFLKHRCEPLDHRGDRSGRDQEPLARSPGCNALRVLDLLVEGRGPYPHPSFAKKIFILRRSAPLPLRVRLRRTQCEQMSSGLPAPESGRCPIQSGCLKGARKWPSHSITSSAAAKKASGTFMSSALAVVRLMPRLNLVGCSTGRSAGRAPCRIRETK
jgi:hypothetical protein